MFRKPHKTQTLIGKTTFLKGHIKTEGTIRIDGSIDGSVEADWVIIGSGGYCKGQIISKRTLVKGKVEGIIESHELIEIKSGGIIIGDIITPKITIDEGKFLGQSLMPAQQEEAEAEAETGTDTSDEQDSPQTS